ncbi:hypothetical protein THRCLA_04485 [Thraustotheca clavata]|uniref:Tc1-like transposase DDE domain-containing protein n=1 Tax=Thraustotheca clavata TaxID=74557 RepID=A0A1V9ZZ28_9STRA|nr:hypothetical protein THRCLA_04485 [Thraustotheca clavata]
MQPMVKHTKEFLKKVDEYVKKQHPRALIFEEKLDILYLQVKLRREEATDVASTVTSTKHRSDKTIKKRQCVVAVDPTSNGTTHSCVIPNTSSVIANIQSFVRARGLLDEKKHISLDWSNEGAVAATLRAAQPFFKKKGLKRGNDQEMLTISPKNMLYYAVKRGRHHDSLYHPDETELPNSNEKHKGQRYYFIVALVELGPLSTKCMHCSLGDDIPRRCWKKYDLQLACLEYGIAISPFHSKAMLWSLIEDYIKTNCLPVIVEMARARGYDVIYTPPHDSSLQPIEIVWANIKRLSGKKFCGNYKKLLLLQTTSHCHYMVAY